MLLKGEILLTDHFQLCPEASLQGLDEESLNEIVNLCYGIACILPANLCVGGEAMKELT